MKISVCSDSLLSVDSYRGGVTFLDIVPRYWKNNLSNDQEVVQTNQTLSLKQKL